MDIIFDIDGTVANIDHRLHHVREKPKNWPAFDKAIPHDGVIEPVKVLYDMFVGAGEWSADDPFHRVLFASGRSERSRDNTEAWLEKNDFTGYQKLYMRPDKDYRPDFEIKAEILAEMRSDGYDPTICFDDRIGVGGKNGVVQMWPQHGVFCFCVNQGLKEF